MSSFHQYSTHTLVIILSVLHTYLSSYSPRVTIPPVLHTSYFTNIRTYLSSLHMCMSSMSLEGAVITTPSENTIQTVLTYLRRQQRKRKPTEQCRRTRGNYLKRY